MLTPFPQNIVEKNGGGKLVRENGGGNIVRKGEST
jgi:hypothetical protein